MGFIEVSWPPPSAPGSASDEELRRRRWIAVARGRIERLACLLREQFAEVGMGDRDQRLRPLLGGEELESRGRNSLAWMRAPPIPVK